MPVLAAYRLLLDSARAVGDQNACGIIADAGLVKVPASLRIRVALAICRLPRWGGSYAQVDAVATAADAFVAETDATNAGLANLQQYVLETAADEAYDLLEAKDPGGAIIVRRSTTPSGRVSWAFKKRAPSCSAPPRGRHASVCPAGAPVRPSLHGLNEPTELCRT